jgi:hypothetical protein
LSRYPPGSAGIDKRPTTTALDRGGHGPTLPSGVTILIVKPQFICCRAVYPNAVYAAPPALFIRTNTY